MDACQKKNKKIAKVKITITTRKRKNVRVRRGY